MRGKWLAGLGTPAFCVFGSCPHDHKSTRVRHSLGLFEIGILSACGQAVINLCPRLRADIKRAVQEAQLRLVAVANFDQFGLKIRHWFRSEKRSGSSLPMTTPTTVVTSTGDCSRRKRAERRTAWINRSTNAGPYGARARQEWTCSAKGSRDVRGDFERVHARAAGVASRS